VIDRILIVGASQAGLQVAVSLRELGFTGSIALVGDETHAPYQRPPLSKAYLAGKATVETLSLRTPEFYTEHGIELLTGTRVTALDLDAGKATAERGEQLGFDQVALTTGAQVRRLKVPGADLAGVVYLRDLTDADHLAALMPAARSVVVVGGGFIGLEAAAVARAAGKDVTVVETAPRLIARAVAPLVSDFYREAHERRGTRILLDRSVASLTAADGRVTAANLDDGTTLAADLVVVGIGVDARTELAAAAGLTVDRGVVVDPHARTSDPRVVAAGDCTVLPHPAAPGQLIRLESVQNAVDQSRVAAATLLGQQAVYDAVPWFWSDQDDLKLQIAGLSMGYDHVVVRGDTEKERFSALYYRDRRLIAADSVNRAPDYMVVRRALAAGHTIPAELATNTDVSLKSLLRP
jgi:3-phenylpropionate/trans-cinnamate dioxygenase ferredoxin reductase subunit